MPDQKNAAKARRVQNRESQQRFRQRRRQETDRLLYWPAKAMADTVWAEPRAVLGSRNVLQDPLAHAHNSANQYEQPHELTQWTSPVFPSDSVCHARPASCPELQVPNIQRPHEALLSEPLSPFDIGCQAEDVTSSSASLPQDAFWCSSVWNAHSSLPPPPPIAIAQDTSTDARPDEAINARATCTELRVTEDTSPEEPNQKVLGRYSKATDVFTAQYGRNPFEEKINQIADDLLEVHRVGVSMSFMIPDDGLIKLVNAVKRRIEVANIFRTNPKF
ncbi:hypothetical protein BDV96DRAFT_652483 [Lophiotrema nucula]|uniref:BZIP domain-containing protein n=1 Tax=Lophiotrema nucula TaxID=690887 RepID=A0A6A5YP11_9PLEO|nr:hypothetical protein BDV96DRAFT_652483 [Lophiotrema nucula]